VTLSLITVPESQEQIIELTSAFRSMRVVP